MTIIRSTCILSVLKILLILTIGMPQISAQCITDYQKIGPHELQNSKRSLDYGRAIDIHKDLAVIGISDSDSLQETGGLVHLYKYDGTNWNKLGDLMPALPEPYENFGKRVQIIDGAILVTVFTRNTLIEKIKGSVYVFEKPISGWATMTETAKISLPDSVEYLSYAEINKENSTIVMRGNRNQLYFYKKQGAQWVDNAVPTAMIDYSGEGYNILDVAIDADVCAVSLEKSGDNSNLRVYKTVSRNWNDYQEVFAETKNRNRYTLYGEDVKLLNDNLLVSADNHSSDTVFLYTTNDSWTSANEVVLTSSNANEINHGEQGYGVYMDMNDSTVIVGRTVDGPFTSKISIYKKPITGWTSATEDFVITTPLRHLIIYGPALAMSGSQLITRGEYDGFPGQDVDQVVFYSFDNANNYQEEKRLIYQEHNTTGAKFGRKVALNERDSIMAVAMYTDGRPSAFGGVVNLYSKDQNKQWNFLSTVKPSDIDTLIHDFGHDIGFYEDHMIVSAPNYKEPNYNTSTGAVFVYKKSGLNWEDPQFIAKLRPSDWEDYALDGAGGTLRFGQSIAIEGNTIAVGAPRHNEQGVYAAGRIYVFEKEANNDWVSESEKAILTVSDPISQSYLGSSVSIDNQIIVSPRNNSDKEDAGQVYLFERPDIGWKDTTETHRIELQIDFFNPTIGLRGSRAILQDDLLFVGAPYQTINGENHTGAIHILKKSINGWSEIQSINQVTISSPKGREYIGNKYDVYGNLMLIGNTFNGYRYSSYPPYDDELHKGEVVLLQSKTDDWSEVTELVRFEGDKTSTYDEFGESVVCYKDNILIGAIHDDSETGFGSGAVYSILPPPNIKLVDPTCVNATPFELEAYPVNGNWSGSGIIDPISGLFDPSIAGVGTHELIYITPNCTYEGILKIDVAGELEISFLHANELIICESDSVNLTIESIINGGYQWYYSESLNSSPIALGDNTTELLVGQEGYYYVEVSNGLCDKISEPIHVRQLVADIEISEPPIICDLEELVSLDIQPQGGLWNTQIIADNQLDPSSLNDGIHQFIYTVTLEATCDYLDTLSIEVDELKEVAIEYLDEDNCLNGAEFIVENDNTVNYLWEYNEGGVWRTASGNYSEASYSAENDGLYRLNISKHGCALQLEEMRVYTLPPDSIFVPNVITANSDLINDTFELFTQNLNNIQLSIYNRWGKQIYLNENYDNSWPNNDVPSAGIYYYYISYDSECEVDVKPVKGYITVMH